MSQVPQQRLQAFFRTIRDRRVLVLGSLRLYRSLSKWLRLKLSWLTRTRNLDGQRLVGIWLEQLKSSLACQKQ